MQTFISESLSKIISQHASLEDVVIILPSKRAGVFVREESKKQIKVGFLPVIYSIEDFVSEVSGLEKTDNIQLLFYLYEVYKTLEKEPQSFDVFSSWALTALQDFNEADQYLVDTKDLFTYVRDIKRLQKWSIEENVEETEMMKSHFTFVEKLGKLYNSFSKSLIDKKKGYQGLLFKEAIQNIDAYIAKNKQLSFYFLGFNALTKSEEVLIQRVLQHPSSEIFWDIDEAFLNSDHQAGTFIRKYASSWKHYQNNTLQTTSKHFISSKNIEVIGVTKNVSQVKEVSQVLQKLEDYRSTALVLGDESLLSVMLNSLPEKVPSINITMGYALKEMPAYQFIKDYFDLYITRERLNNSSTSFYHKSLQKLLSNSLFRNTLTPDDKQNVVNLTDSIVKQNMSFVSVEFITSTLKNSSISKLFKENVTIDNFIDEIISFINYSRDFVSDLEKEYLYRFYGSFIQLQNLNQEYDFFKDLKNLYSFFKQIIGKETLSFQGEPLSGLQCMGVLETRVLDFENVIITSVNEGIIPKNGLQNSFIPFDVKIHFGLPTYKEKDAIFSYHFFRLLQRAKNIFLFYNTESDDFGGGEKSRFISQLELMRSDIYLKTVSPKIPKEKTTPLVIQKNEEIIEALKERVKKGFSPSALGSYLYNPIEFYKQKILGLQEKEEVEETIAANTLGNIVHKTLEELYLPYLNKFLTFENIEEMEKLVVKKIDSLFPNYFRKGSYQTGKNKLMYEIIVSYIFRFLHQEKQLLKEGKSLKVLDVEKQIEAEFSIEGFDFPIRLYGEIDRIDLLDGTLRIVDYKTGVVEKGDVKIPHDWNLNDKKHSKAIQLLIYAYMFHHSSPKKFEKIKAGNISFKRLKEGFLPITFISKDAKQHITIERLKDFEISVGEIFKEIFDVSVPFTEK